MYRWIIETLSGEFVRYEYSPRDASTWPRDRFRVTVEWISIS